MSEVARQFCALTMKSSKTNFEERVPLLQGRRDFLKNESSLHEMQCRNMHQHSARRDTQTPTAKYPRAVIFVLASKFFESFAANGVRTVLALFLKDSFCFSENIATIILHVFNFFSQFCPIFGAILADNYFGNKKTVFYLYFIYALGYIGILLLMFDILILPVNVLLVTSILLIAIGNGSIRACITSMGGYQFKLPEQQTSLSQYFSQYYFVYYIGILLGKVIPPSIRAHSSIYTYCSGVKTHSYTLLFVVLTSIFLISWVFFIVGLKFYKREVANSSNVFTKIIDCIGYAVYRKIKCPQGQPIAMYWIENSIGRYSSQFVDEVWIFVKLVKVFLPLSIYFALLAQQDSTWTFQVVQMNTKIFGIYIEPDQIKSIGPILFLLFIPLWRKLVTHFKINITPFCCITIGGFCTVASFLCAAWLEIKIQHNSHHRLSSLYQLPQFVFLMMGELLISIPALQFIYTEAPAYMKSLMTALWFCNNAFGNLLVVLITESNLIHNTIWHYFFYAALMFIAIILFLFMSRNYERQTLLFLRQAEEPHLTITTHI